MMTTATNDQTAASARIRRGSRIAVAALLAVVLLGACGHLAMMLHGGPEPPPASEFGFGPRNSAGGHYVATLESKAPLRVRRMQSVKLSVRSADGTPVEGASIVVDGGMPQHGHGLPTQPRVTRELGQGMYQVDGVRFNMGGWWELKFEVDAPAAASDTVTFNLDL